MADLSQFAGVSYIPKSAGGLILGGKVWPCDVPVFNPGDHGLEVKIGDGARRRFPKQTELDLFVLHWTGGENPPPKVFDVLDGRELGVEFSIGKYGDVWQFADPILVDTFDAGPVNKRSAGVEIINCGWKSEGRASASNFREEYTTRLHGRPRRFTRFYPAQIRAAIALVDAIIKSEQTLIKRRIPRDGSGALITSVMGGGQLAAYEGVLGHFHITADKSDPGTDIFDAFAAAGY